MVTNMVIRHGRFASLRFTSYTCAFVLDRH